MGGLGTERLDKINEFLHVIFVEPFGTDEFCIQIFKCQVCHA